MADFRITVAGDSALNLEFGQIISAKTSTLIRQAALCLTEDGIKGVTELIPTFCSLMVQYDPLVIGFDELCEALQGKLRNIGATESSVRHIVLIPTCYGGEYGPDMPTVVAHSGLTEQEVIAIHSGHDYLIDMLGFLPGFAYLGGLDPRLHTPRLATPRTLLEAGSVGIGGAQTGVYPLPSPGGWQIIGRTPIKPYDPDREKPILYAAGEYLRFVPITPAQYKAIERQVAQGTYEYQSITQEG